MASLVLCFWTWFTLSCILHAQMSHSQSLDGQLYCKHEDKYYAIGEKWRTMCNEYTCTNDGPSISTQLVNCTINPVEKESRNCFSTTIEVTDSQDCCNTKAFCPFLPPHLFDGSEYKPPVTYGCPDGWTNIQQRESGTAAYCMKTFPEKLPYHKAKQKCRDLGFYLVNLDLPSVSSYIRRQGKSLAISGTSYWTGLNFDGSYLAWDGVVPGNPELTLQLQCRDEIFTESSAFWPCNFDEQWSQVVNDDFCIGATYSNEKNLFSYEISGCEEGKGYICSGSLEPSTAFKTYADTTRCEQGWEWNPYTKLCVQYVSTKDSRPGYTGAVYDCTSKNASLLTAETKEHQFLLYSIMKTRSPKPASVWISSARKCEQIKNPYIAGTETLDSLKSLTSCTQNNPYVCVKDELPSRDKKIYSTQLIQRSGEVTELECLTVPKYKESQANQTFRISDVSLLFSNIIRQQPLDGGGFQCVAHHLELSDYVYSNILNVDFNEEFYYIYISIPLEGSSHGWFNMIKYYPQFYNSQNGENINIRNMYENVLQKSFNLTKSNITLQCQCENSYLNSETRASLVEITNIVSLGASRFRVTALVAFYNQPTIPARKKRQLRLEGNLDNIDIGRIAEFNVRESNWANLEKYLTANIAAQTGSTAEDIGVSSLDTCRATEVTPAGLSMKLTLDESPVGTERRYSICPSTGKPLAVFRCERLPGGINTWIESESEVCSSNKDLSAKTRDLLDLSVTTINRTNFLQVLESTEQLTSDRTLEVSDVAYTAQILQNIATIDSREFSLTLTNSSQVEKYMDWFTKAVSNVMTSSDSALLEAETNTNSSSIIIDLTERLINTPSLSNVITENMDVYQGVHPNLAFRLTTKADVIGIMSLEEEINSKTINYVSASDSGVAAGQINNNKIVGLSLKDEALNPTIRRSFTVFGNNKLHKAKKKVFKAIDRIASASVAEMDGSVLVMRDSFNDLITLHYPKTVSKVEDTSGLACGFYKVASSEWSDEGCITVWDKVNGVFCYCNHLTDFSVLLDIRGRTDSASTEEVHRQALTIITIIGLSLSIAALCFVILTAMMFKRLRKTVSQKVLIALSLSLLGLNITFLVGVDRTETYTGCVTVAVFLHYFLLTSFAWMLVEAILQYLRFVKVLGTYIPKFMLKATIPSLLIPAVIVAITLAIDVDLYKASDEYCWLQTDAVIYSVLIPIALILVANLGVFIMVIHGLTCARRRMRATMSPEAERAQAMLHLRAGIAVFVVLGLTWIFGFIALIEHTSIVFQYLFCIFNSLQGLLIFIFHNIREPAVINAWKKICSCGRYKEQTSTSGQRLADHGKSSTTATDKRQTNMTSVSNRKTDSLQKYKTTDVSENMALN